MRPTHNQREQRRARRINDKISQLKGFLEVRMPAAGGGGRRAAAGASICCPNLPPSPPQFQGYHFKADKYSILDSACVQLQFLYELLVEVGAKAGWENPEEGRSLVTPMLGRWGLCKRPRAMLPFLTGCP